MQTNSGIEAFGQYVKASSIDGVDSYHKKTKYVPRSKLERYWQDSKVQDIFFSCYPTVFVNIEEIQSSYLLVLSILVYIGRPDAISLFTEYELHDNHLPLVASPPQWLDTSRCDELFQEFDRHQWKFCPADFGSSPFHKKHFDPRRILPVTYEQRLSKVSEIGDVSIVWKVKIHDGYYRQNTFPQGTGVFKEYQTDDEADLWSQEADIYASLGSLSWETIARCHGSFQQNERRTIILEYAPGGTLLDFLIGTSIPNGELELEELWNAAIQLLLALHCIHEMRRPGDLSEFFLSAIHGDIKPVNILVFPQDKESRFNVKFKLADFGVTRLRKQMTGVREGNTESNDGNRTYTPPESCNIYPIQDRIPTRVGSYVDVWALGAVFSEILVWSVLSKEGRQEYHRRRVAEISMTELNGTGYDACFHNGTSKLNAVEAMHDEAIGARRHSDNLTCYISDIILDHMLQPWNRGRLSAIDTFHKAEDKLKKARAARPNSLSHESEDTVSKLSTSHSVRHKSQRNTTLNPLQRSHFDPFFDTHRPHLAGVSHTFPALPHSQSVNSQPDSSTGWAESQEENFQSLTTGPEPSKAAINTHYNGCGSTQFAEPQPDNRSEAYDLLKQKDNKLGWLSRGLPPKMMLRPGIPDALSKIKAIGGREQYILVDDFTSMAQHKPKVTKVARVISYYIKNIDPNKMELYFASNIQAPIECRNSTDVESAIQRHDFVQGTCNMKSCLGNLVESIWQATKYVHRPISIYVFTDGIWEDSDPLVDTVILNAVQRMKGRDLLAHWLMIQFIRFGKDELGRQRLDYLDDDLVQKYQLGEFDVVDTKHYKDPVPDILVGSITQINDKKKNHH